MKISVVGVEALKRKEREDETQFTTKLNGFLSYTPALNANLFSIDFFLSHPVYDQTHGYGAVFFYR